MSYFVYFSSIATRQLLLWLWEVKLNFNNSLSVRSSPSLSVEKSIKKILWKCRCHPRKQIGSMFWPFPGISIRNPVWVSGQSVFLLVFFMFFRTVVDYHRWVLLDWWDKRQRTIIELCSDYGWGCFDWWGIFFWVDSRKWSVDLVFVGLKWFCSHEGVSLYPKYTLQYVKPFNFLGNIKKFHSIASHNNHLSSISKLLIFLQRLSFDQHLTYFKPLKG